MLRRGVHSAARQLSKQAERRAANTPVLLTRRNFLVDDIPENPRPRTNTVINICHQGTITVVERFGKYSHDVKPGLFFAIPVIDSLYQVDLREHVINITPQGAITKDNVRIELCGALYLRFDDPFKALYGAKRPLFAAVQQAQSVMRSCVGQMEMDDLFHNRASLNAAVQMGIQNATEHWGLTVNRYEVTDITPDPEIAKAMDLQAAAERHRREKVKAATAEKEATILISEGRKIQMINEAQGAAESIVRNAVAKAEAIEKIARVLDTKEDGARRAMEFEIAQKYFEYMKSLGQSPSTVFIPTNVGDISGVVAQGVASFRALSQQFGNDAQPPPAVGGSDSDASNSGSGISSSGRSFK